MSPQNSLVKKQAQNTNVVEYESNGETVRLGPNMIRNYLVSGGGNVTDQEVMMFLNLCRFQHLNPFLREAYLIKYGNSSPATMVVGKDVLLKRAMRDQDFDGLLAGVIVLDNTSGDVTEREGTFYLQGRETLVGGWAKVFLKNCRQPFYESVSIDEYIGKKGNGEINSMWSGKPATMIRKVALAHALREAFPEETAGMYVQEEISEISDIPLDESPVQVPDEQPEPIIEPATIIEPEQSPAAALFS